MSGTGHRLTSGTMKIVRTDLVLHGALVFYHGLPTRQASDKARGLLRISTHSNRNTSGTLLDICHKVQKGDLDE